MNNKVFLKLLIITIVLAFIDIILFSPGIYGLTYGQNPGLFLGTIVTNVGVLMGEMIYLSKSNTAKYGYDLDKLKDIGDYRQALESCYSKKSPFTNEIKKAISQVTSMEKKNMVLNEILVQNNKGHFTALTDLGNQATNFLVGNVRKILNRIAIFDTDMGDQIVEDYAKYINNLLDSNENILIEFNKLLTEVSQLDDTTTDDTLGKVLSDMTNSLKTLRGEEI